MPPEPPAAGDSVPQPRRSPASASTAPNESGSAAPPRRVRVVVAGNERVRTDPVLEVEEQTDVGDVLIRGLIRAQLALALRLSALVAGLFGVLPLLFALTPRVSVVRVFGLELPWLLLGAFAYPVVIGVAWVYVQLADRNERDFLTMLDRD